MKEKSKKPKIMTADQLQQLQWAAGLADKHLDDLHWQVVFRGGDIKVTDSIRKSRHLLEISYRGCFEVVRGPIR